MNTVFQLITNRVEEIPVKEFLTTASCIFVPLVANYHRDGTPKQDMMLPLTELMRTLSRLPNTVRTCISCGKIAEDAALYIPSRDEGIIGYYPDGRTAGCMYWVCRECRPMENLEKMLSVLIKQWN